MVAPEPISASSPSSDDTALVLAGALLLALALGGGLVAGRAAHEVRP
jgi:uncharacterized protein involved in exopolysaccharide biosynthesis